MIEVGCLCLKALFEPFPFLDAVSLAPIAEAQTNDLQAEAKAV
jgi:hypothetical protein